MFRISLVAFMAVWLGMAPLYAEQDHETFAQAVQDHKEGKYDDAVRKLSLLALRPGVSPEVFYNMAVAQQKSGKPLEAALNYRRVLVLRPDFLQARRNLDVLNVEDGVPLPRWTWREDLAAIVRPELLMLLGVAIAWTGAFGFVIFLFKKERKGALLFTAGAVFVIGSALGVTGYLSEPRVTEASTALVMRGGGVTVRENPVDSARAVVRLPAGSAIQVLSERSGWVFCTLPDGGEGWIKRSDVEFVIPRRAEAS